jgi:hypothetical protein
MMKKTMIAAALTLVFSAPAFSDTPIGKGVTGSGGTGANQADVESKAREAQTPPQTQKLNPDGSESSRGSASVGRPANANVQDGARGATSVNTDETSGVAVGVTPDGKVDGKKREPAR